MNFAEESRMIREAFSIIGKQSDQLLDEVYKTYNHLMQSGAGPDEKGVRVLVTASAPLLEDTSSGEKPRLYLGETEYIYADDVNLWYVAVDATQRLYVGMVNEAITFLEMQASKGGEPDKIVCLETINIIMNTHDDPRYDAVKIIAALRAMRHADAS